MQEKPKKPRSRHAIVAIYLFKPTIFEYLANTKKKTDPDKQLAEAFNKAIRNGSKVIGIILKKNEKRIDIGTPESYAKVLGSLKDIEKQGKKIKPERKKPLEIPKELSAYIKKDKKGSSQRAGGVQQRDRRVPVGIRGHRLPVRR